MSEVKSYHELQEQKPFKIFCFSSLKSQEVVFVEAGIKTVSNILLFLSRSSLSSPPPFSAWKTLLDTLKQYIVTGVDRKKMMNPFVFRPGEEK